MLSIVLVALIIINSVLFYDNRTSINDIEFYIPLISIVISVYSVFPRIQKKFIVIRLIHIIILGILFFNLPWYIYSLFFEKEFLSKIFFRFSLTEEIFVKSVFLLSSSLCVIAFTYRTIVLKSRIKFRQELPKIFPRENIFLIIFFISFFITIYQVGFEIGKLFTGEVSYSYTLSVKSLQLFVIILLYKFLNSNISNPFKPSIYSPKSIVIAIGITGFVLYTLIGGDRGPVFSLLLMITFGILFKMGMRVKTKLMVPLLVILVSFFVLMRITQEFRLLRGEVSIGSLTEAKTNYEDREEMLGFSSLCTNLAIEGIEKNVYPHTYGFLFLSGVLKGIPFFGNYSLSLLFGSDSVYKVGSASLLTYQYLGPNPKFGIGSTYIADLFIDFGFIGVVIGSVFLGLVVGYLDLRIIYGRFENFYHLLLLLSFVASAFYLGRGTVHGFITNYLFLFFFYITTLFFHKRIK